MNIIYHGELEKRTVKEVLRETIPQLCEKDPRVFYLDADLMACAGTVDWSKKNPRHSVNCGIAEANMVGVAAGMALEGFRPIIHSFAAFISRRAFDQMFLSAAYAQNAVTVLGSDAGVTAEYNGGTHMAFEDMALYRAIPGATVLDISSGVMMADLLEQCVNLPGIKYLRFGRKAYPRIYAEDAHFVIGKAIEVRPGNDAAIFASGVMVAEAVLAAEQLQKEGIEAAVVDMFTVKPLDEAAVIAYAKKTGAVVTAENHSVVGGLYSAVSDLLARRCPVRMDFVAVEDRFGEVGPIEYLKQQFGLTPSAIADKVRRLVRPTQPADA